MNLKQTRLITNDLPRLTHFYEVNVFTAIRQTADA